MQEVLDPINFPTICDSITLQLVDSATLLVTATDTKVIDVNGYGTFNFTGLAPLQQYYLVIRTRNAIETWSKNTYLFNTPSATIDFTRP